MSLLEVRGLVVRYGRLVAVQEIDVSLDAGEIAVMIGSNGAGKSSTLNAISGAVPKAAGQVTFAGQDITRKRSHQVAKAGLVQVPEGRRIIAPLSVEDNLLLGAYNLRSRNRRTELLRSVFDMFPVLEERREGPGGLLSGGEQQMLAFGRALMADPTMLLLDEPSMGLAPIIVDQIMDAVREIAGRGISILMVEQNAAAAFGVAQNVHVLEQGQIVLHGAVDEVQTSPLVVRAFLGLEAEPEAEANTPNQATEERAI
jgi:branched-chain amino acid transport system ATP-binding protein